MSVRKSAHPGGPGERVTGSGAVWRASRAAVKRRRVQTFVIGCVVLCSTATAVLALGLLVAASAPFDRAFNQQRGAHAVATFDATKVSSTQLARTAQRPGVRAAAGPFGQATLDVPDDWLWRPPGPLTVVGRPDPAGPVDRVELLSGRWATAPGELVVNATFTGRPNPKLLGTRLAAPGAPPLTVVGFANSMSRSADAWVAPEQLAALHPNATQMLYRFAVSSTDAQVNAGLAAVTAGLPADSLTAAQSYHTLKRAFSALVDSYLPFIAVFGVLGLVVSVLIVGNVVSGAVVAGYRHIGVLKALGFTPNQVVAVYLTMISVPAAVGSLLGALAGTLLAPPILRVAFSGIETGTAAIGLGPWVPVGSLLGMLALVLVAAAIPALRAHRVPAAQAITAGSAPRAGRGLRVQRRLSASRLPRTMSLGLGQPFARPGRALLTMAAIVFGVTAVTLATGLTSTMVAYGHAGQSEAAAYVDVQVGDDLGDRGASKLTDQQIDALLRSGTGVDRVTARALLQVQVVGHSRLLFANFYQGDAPNNADQIVRGRWPVGPGEVAAGPAFLTQLGLAVGDRITLGYGGRQAPATIVGELIEGDARSVESNWPTLAALAPDTPAVDFSVALAPGTDAQAYADTIKAADPGLHPSVRGTGNAATTTVVTFSTVFTVLLTVVAALGVFNTVLLNTRERRRELGVLKSIGMTPGQVIGMTVTSVAALGVLGGLLGVPIGVVAHRLLVDNVGVVEFPESMKSVWHAPQLTALDLAGVAIAVLGALIPARSAARLTSAEVLHNE